MVHLLTVGVTYALMLWQYFECIPQPLQKMAHEVSISDNPTSANITTITVLHGDSADVTLKITDDQGRVLDTDSLPFGIDIQLKMESANKNKAFSLVPFWCQLISVTSNRKYAILRNGCGDGIMISRTDGFTMHNGTGYSPVFRALDFSNDNKIKFSCTYVVKKYIDYDSSCNNASAILREEVRSTHDNVIPRNHVKGGNSYSDAFKSVESRVIGLSFPQQHLSVDESNSVLEINGSSRHYIDEWNMSGHLRSLILTMASFGVYLFILAMLITIYHERNKTENVIRC